MRRIPCPERDDWQATAEAAGFDFHTPDGERYWDERAYYAFSLDEIECQIEAPTGEIHAMCLELVERAMGDENVLRRLKIPPACWPILTESWQRDDATLYGRFDFSFDGSQFAALALEPAHELAARLLARTQGVALVAQAYDDAALIEREIKGKPEEHLPKDRDDEVDNTRDAGSGNASEESHG